MWTFLDLGKIWKGGEKRKGKEIGNYTCNFPLLGFFSWVFFFFFFFLTLDLFSIVFQ
jgi:hypothetical protein